MKKVTIITGPQGAGKSSRAREISQGRKVYETEGSLSDALKTMPIDTDLIILDIGFQSDILKAITADALAVKRAYQAEPIAIRVPDLIITTYLSVELIEKIQATEIIKLSANF